MVENQISGKTKCCNVGDLKPKHPSGDGTLKPSSIGRATRFINHPDNLPDVDISIDCDLTPNVQRYPGVRTDTRYNLRKSFKTPTKLNLRAHTQKQKKCKKFSKKNEKEGNGVRSPIPISSVDP